MPCGRPIDFYSAYDAKDHWRYLHDNRNYEVMICPYNDLPIEEGTYDFLLEKRRGYKWELCEYFMNNFDYSKYEYVAFFDDDIITDFQSINRAIEIAYENSLKIFQLSLVEGSYVNHPLTAQDKSLKYTLTNFVECMSPFYHVSILKDFKDLWNYHKFLTGWGLDCIVSDALKTPSAIIHEVNMYHKPVTGPSWYDRGEAYGEMVHIWKNVFPRYMKDKYNEDAVFVDNIMEISRIPK